MLPEAVALDLDGTGPLANASVQVTDDAELRFHDVGETVANNEGKDNVLSYGEAVNRLNLLLVKDRWSIGSQLDSVALLANQYRLDGVLYNERDLLAPDVVSPWDNAYLLIEKSYIQRRGDTADITVGDTYASFGRGIALNIVKNTDIDVDTSIRGVKAVLRAGPQDITLVSGITNAQQVSQDNKNGQIDDDPGNMVTGARIEHYGLGPANVGVHGVLYAFSRGDDGSRLHTYGGPVDAMVTGATLELPGVAGVDWYLEGDAFGYQGVELAGGEEPLLAYATYGSASFYPGKATVLVEAKKTSETERLQAFTGPAGWEVSNIPTLEYERVITEDSTAAVNSDDISGARVRIDYTVRPGQLMPYVSLAGFYDEDTAGLHFNESPEVVAHPVAGVQWFTGERVIQLNAGYRQDTRTESAEGADQLLHADGEVHLPVGEHNAVEVLFSAKSFQWGVNQAQQSDYVEMENSLSWHQGDKLVFVLYQDYSDNPLIQSSGNITDQVYGALELIWRPATAHAFKAFYGAYKAGIRCSGGACRSLPGFEGGRVSYTGTF